jgi:hypothetical protein
MDIEQLIDTDALELVKSQIVSMLASLKYPKDHPFLSVNSDDRSDLVLICYLKALLIDLLGNDTIIDSYIKKRLHSSTHNNFDILIFNQNMNELRFLYYLLISIYRSSIKDCLKGIDAENYNDINIEYSLLLHTCDLPLRKFNIEVKTLMCDPIFKEETIPFHDKQLFIMPYFKSSIEENLSEIYPDAYFLKKSSWYRALNKRLKQINDKFKKNKYSSDVNVNIGVIDIEGSTSPNDFFVCMFNKEYGLYYKTDITNIDVIIFFSREQICDWTFSNIYQNGYVQTLLLKNTSGVKEYLELLRLDNYIDIQIVENSDISKATYSKFMLIMRDGKYTFTSTDTTDVEINNYFDRIEKQEVYYRSME